MEDLVIFISCGQRTAGERQLGRVYLLPAVGDRKLDAIESEHVQRLKHDLQTKSPKTVNNILAVLSVTLRRAVEWEVIDRMPCLIKLLPPSRGSTEFYDFDEFERLGEAARLRRRSYSSHHFVGWRGWDANRRDDRARVDRR